MENLRTQLSIRKVVLISILVAFSVILSVFDKYISMIAFPFLPTAKIGLANLVILVAVYRFNFGDSFKMTLLKSLLAGLILGSAVSFIISVFASLLSFFGMYLFHKLIPNAVSPISVSVIGGFLHITGQLFIVYMLYRIGDSVFYYGAVLIIVSLITSIIIGYIGIRLIDFHDRISNENS